MASKRALDAATDLLRRGGMPNTQQLQQFLSRDSRQPATDLPIDPNAVLQSALKGFLMRAAEGYTFVDPQRIVKEFGRTLDENYPEAGPAFLKFAHSYWTLKLLAGDPDIRPDYSNAAALLSQLEESLAGLFFPTPGPVKIDPDVREAKQREILTTASAPIDISDFLTRNPILIRDRRGQASGCLGAFVLFTYASLRGIAELRHFAL